MFNLSRKRPSKGSAADLLAVQNAYFALRQGPSHPSLGQLAARPGTAKPPQHFAKLNLWSLKYIYRHLQKVSLYPTENSVLLLTNTERSMSYGQ